MEVIPVPAEATTNPWAWVAFVCVVALAFVSYRYLTSLEGQIGKERERGDKLLADEPNKVAAIREAAGVAAKAADLTDKAVNAATQALEASKRNGEKLDATIQSDAQIKSNQDAILRRLESVEKSLDTLTRGERDVPSRRRS